MTNQFLPYPNTWKENAQNKPGDFTQNARSKIFVSLQTFHGIQIAVRSTVKAAKGFLQNGYICILTERFCQDPVEEYFGIQ